MIVLWFLAFRVIRVILGTFKKLFDISKLDHYSGDLNSQHQASASSQVHIGASVSGELIITCMCANLSE